jgi:small-conductance mechanosensitive channel
VLFYFIFFLIKNWAKHERRAFPALIDKHLHKPGLFLFTVITLNIDASLFSGILSPAIYAKLLHALHILLILSIGFALVKVANFLYDVILLFYKRREVQDYELRSIRTKYLLISRIIHLIIVIGTIVSILFTFAAIRQFGAAFIASAGIAGIVIGFAAQKSLGTIFAGIQMALTQAIKLDDILVVDGIYGTVGEITLTYVVLNTWDEKRRIIPINRFIDNSFENWTRQSPEVTGEVKVHADYTLPIEEIKPLFQTWLKQSKLWDGRSSYIGISGAEERTIVVRTTMSARNSGESWQLENYIREKLVALIRDKYSFALPARNIKIENFESIA